MDRLSQTLYVGNLPGDICESEIEDLFCKYGPIVDIELKFPPRQPAYAFVEFEDYRDADDAIHGRDGYNLDGHRLRVEPSARERRGPSSYSEGGRRGGSRHSGHKGRSNNIIYVGNLPGDVRVREVEDIFYKYGPIVEVDLKTPPRPPVYAFVEFEDPRDADDAIRGRDGYNFDGHRLRVELARGGRGSSSYDSYRSYSSGSNHGGLSRHSDFRVLVTGLPFSASWQDLKDHMRRAGDVCFSEVYRDRDGMRGIVDYSNYDDMKYAVRKLDDSLFHNQSSRAYIRVEEYDSRRSFSRSPSRGFYSRSRSPSHSSGYSDSRSLSRSESTRAATRHRSRSRTPAASVSAMKLPFSSSAVQYQ